MFAKFSALLKKETTWHILVNTIGNYGNVVFTAGYTFWLVRQMSPADYGIFSILFSVIFVLTNIFDFGVAAAIFSSVPAMIGNPAQSAKFLKTNFIFQTSLTVIGLTVLTFFLDSINNDILKLSIPHSYYYWTFLSIIMYLWQNFFLNTLYAAKKFILANIVITFSNIIRLIALGGLVYFSRVRIDYVIVALGVIGPLTIVLTLLVVKRRYVLHIHSAKVEKNDLKIGYTLIYLVATQCYNLASRLDLFIMSYFLTKTEVGYYAVVQKIITTILSAVNSITQVLSPQFAVVKKRLETTQLLKKSYLYVSFPAVFLIAIACTPTAIFTWFFGQQYAAAIPVLHTLSLVNIIFGFTAVPLLFFLYTIKKPWYVLFNNALMLIIITSINWVLVPKMGISASIWASSAAYGAMGIFLYFSLRKEINTLPD